MARNALMFAAQNGHDLCARALLEANADPETQTLKGSTALILAAQNGHEQVHSSQFEYAVSCRQLRCARFHTLCSYHLFTPFRAGRPGTTRGGSEERSHE